MPSRCRPFLFMALLMSASAPLAFRPAHCAAPLCAGPPGKDPELACIEEERKGVETELKAVADRLVVLMGREEALMARKTAGLTPAQGDELEVVSREMFMRLAQNNMLLDKEKRLLEAEKLRQADLLLLETVRVGFTTEGINGRRATLEFSPRKATVDALFQAAIRTGALLIRGPPQSGESVGTVATP